MAHTELPKTARELEAERRINARAIAPVLAQAVLALPPADLKRFLMAAVPTYASRAELNILFAAWPALRGA